MNNINIRLEEPRDYRAVEELTRAAFHKPDRVERSKIDCPMEHWMVHMLRQRDGIMELSFVAEMDGEIVGHIIYSHSHVVQPDGTAIPVVNFGPISVLPKYQRKGIGGALMRHSIEAAKAQGHGAIFFYGHPEYYPRFGFVEAKEYGVTTKDGKNFPAFMGMELKDGYLKGVTEKFVESDIYDDNLNREAVKEFDTTFR